jgi:4-amino-4-deoxy-L-arabinose transferase-like glycosyltransferase
LFTPSRLAIALLLALAIVFFYGTTRTGVLGPDEPRYAAIGTAMAESGDWVTPRLWGNAWFEKPPLVYWTTALGVKLGLGTERAPRLPLALFGLGFVVFFYWIIDKEFGPTEALYATAVLGTSAGWLAYSYVAVMDVPLAACFGAAFLLTFEWMRGGEGSLIRAGAVGALLGLAVLAKGLVPLVLFAPVLWPMRRHWTKLLVIAAACVAVAGPWYVLCTMRNGTEFLNEFFVRHHFGRFASPELQHVRPFWFYVPVLLGLVFPWTPALALIRPGLFRDPRLRFTGLWLLFAFGFFSGSTNKLPGYLMPLIPAVALVLGLGIAWARRARFILFACALLLAIAPIAGAMLPQALEVGLSRTPFRGLASPWTLAFLLAAFAPLVIAIRGRRTEAMTAAALIACIAFLFVKAVALPATDIVRPFYRQHENWLEPVCLHDVDRDARYGLQYYARREFPVCEPETATPRVMGVGPKLLLLD